MGQKPRPKPKRLAAKLLAIRKVLGASQSQMAQLLQLEVSYSRVSEYERGVREPTLMILLSYSQLAGIRLEKIINDAISLTAFRDALNREVQLIEKRR
jgi:transcriptional regulator with XRE-family HTH domain